MADGSPARSRSPRFPATFRGSAPAGPPLRVPQTAQIPARPPPSNVTARSAFSEGGRVPWAGRCGGGRPAQSRCTTLPCLRPVRLDWIPRQHPTDTSNTGSLACSLHLHWPALCLLAQANPKRSNTTAAPGGAAQQHANTGERPPRSRAVPSASILDHPFTRDRQHPKKLDATPQ